MFTLNFQIFESFCFCQMGITFNVIPISVTNHIEKLMQWLELKNCKIWHSTSFSHH
jgi:hypothetical protein